MKSLEAASHAVAATGAVLTLWNESPGHYFVGELRWIDSNQLFWFTAHGDTSSDGRVLCFDTAQIADNAILFFRDGDRIARLATIDRTDVDDPDDYRIAFSIWQETTPRLRPLIERAYQSRVAATPPNDANDNLLLSVAVAEYASATCTAAHDAFETATHWM